MSAIGLFDAHAPGGTGVGGTPASGSLTLSVETGTSDPTGFAVVVNAQPMRIDGLHLIPMDASRITPEAFVGEVVMKQEMTAILQAAKAEGCRLQIGTYMQFEQFPTYLEFPGLPTTPLTLKACVPWHG